MSTFSIVKLREIVSFDRSDGIVDVHCSLWTVLDIFYRLPAHTDS